MAKRKEGSEVEYPILRPWTPFITHEAPPDDPRYRGIPDGGSITRMPSLDDIESDRVPAEDD